MFAMKSQISLSNFYPGSEQNSRAAVSLNVVKAAALISKPPDFSEAAINYLLWRNSCFFAGGLNLGPHPSGVSILVVINQIYPD